MVAMLTINIVQASRYDSFDIPPMNYSTMPWQKSNRIQDGPNVTDTPFAPYMYNNVTKTKWCVRAWSVGECVCINDGHTRLIGKEMRSVGEREREKKPATSSAPWE